MGKKKRPQICCVCIPRKNKHSCSKCKEKKKCCKKKRPCRVIYPIIKNNNIIEKSITTKPDGNFPNQSCCNQESVGNILLTNTTPKMLVWEREPNMNIQMIRVSVYNRPDSTEPMKLRVEADGFHEMEVFPGNTVSYWANRMRKLYVYVMDPKPTTYIEGRYAVQATLLLS